MALPYLRGVLRSRRLRGRLLPPVLLLIVLFAPATAVATLPPPPVRLPIVFARPLWGPAPERPLVPVVAGSRPVPYEER